MRLQALWIAMALPALAQVPRFPTIYYGAAYYHEYMPEERLDKDVELMKKAGLTVVRIGESTWSSWEPRDGQFEYGYIDRVVEAMHRAGIKVILGTPTYSIPPWLYYKHPEILATRFEGRKATYGIRQNMDIAHPAYRYYCERIIRNIISRYRDHPAVIGYQIDNETSHYDAAGPLVQKNFVEYLKRKYGGVDFLNRAWGFVYWGQLVQDWDEFPPRDGILNPGYKLEWERFQRERVTDFLAWQAKIVNEYKRKDQFITHDFSGGAHTDIDQWAIARHLDIAAANPYYDVQDRLDGHSATFTGDVARSLKMANFLVTETNAQTIGWDSKGQFPPYDGQLRLNAYSLIADGANMVSYWHWHSLHYGQETYWKGILSHDLQPNRVYEEFSRTAAELKRVGPLLANLERRNQVAILFSIDSFHGIQFMPFSDRVNYQSFVQQFHRTLYKLNVGVDFVTPESDWSRYRVLLVPPLYVASDADLEKIVAFVRDGGHVIVTLKSGFTNEFDTVRHAMMPGPLRPAAGFRYQEFSTLRQPLPLRGDPFQAGEDNRVSEWAEMLILEGAEALAWYDHPFIGRYPAITRNQFGKGTFTYEGTVLTDALQRAVVLDVLTRAGLTGPDQKLPAPVRVKHGTAAGRKLHFYFNYSSSEQTLPYNYGAAEEVLTGKKAATGESIRLEPWGVAIFREG
ncbi:MAG: beta-galactosidase LacZ [Bryobacteraceae bacterium]|nr:MAG: beta-galactosidase LacZ [Bryobacteraceae bacterium]